MSERKPKLSGQQKALVIKLLGAYFTVTETHQILKEKYDIEVTWQAVYWYWKNHRDAIQAERKAFDNKVEVIPITDKIYRLYQRQCLIDDLRKHLWYEKPLLRHGKPVADKEGKPIVLKLTGNHERINKILDSAQKELEPQKLEHSRKIGIERTEEYKFIVETSKHMEIQDRREILRLLGKAERNGT